MPIPDNSNHLDFGSIAQWFGAAATFSVAAIALFKDRYDRWRRRPTLDLSISPKPPDCHKVTMQTLFRRGIGEKFDCYYLRLWIKNTGKTRAEKVQVYFAKLTRKRDDGFFDDVATFPPMNLRWSNSPLNPEIYADGISPEMGRHCDLGHVVDPGQGPSARTDIAFDLEMTPASDNHIVPPGVYRLALRVAAANSAPQTYDLELTLTGKWFKDEATMFTEGLRIEVLNKGKA